MDLMLTPNLTLQSCLKVDHLGFSLSCDYWIVLGLAENLSRKMRLDESFRTNSTIKRYGQITKVVLRLNSRTFGIATSGFVTHRVAIISLAIV